MMSGVIALVAAVGALIAAALIMTRLFAGPTLYDRALAAHGVVSKVALVCAALAVMAGAPQYVDVALALVLGAFVASAATLKFFRARSFQPTLSRTSLKGERG